ncbi:hypothetical protein B0T20DRAFT_410210 [Sordaria brevicollis]|uniref:Uncharacterized protein n=1 Tax=Sordaria brevicollis TaxID=83679 RepID=A0AAE0PGQ8_SORBR|nr:hypothetical protein B0T20DRAFT_410210 [Sordaria brevicollis]
MNDFSSHLISKHASVSDDCLPNNSTITQLSSMSQCKATPGSLSSTKALWRNGSAFDSRSKGYPFKSGWGHSVSLFGYFLVFDSTVNSHSWFLKSCTLFVAGLHFRFEALCLVGVEIFYAGICKCEFSFFCRLEHSTSIDHFY